MKNLGLRGFTDSRHEDFSLSSEPLLLRLTFVFSYPSKHSRFAEEADDESTRRTWTRHSSGRGGVWGNSGTTSSSNQQLTPFLPPAAMAPIVNKKVKKSSENINSRLALVIKSGKYT